MSRKKNWKTPWFQTARRFFLYGSSKEFNPIHNEIDRIVDYMIAMESILVPEGDFIGRRLKERAASLLINHNINQNEIKELFRDFYKIRSEIVHGDKISSKNNILESNNVRKFEEIIRKIIIRSIQAVPNNEENRKQFLKDLFDVNDDDKANKMIQDFRAIKDQNKKKKVFDFISQDIDKPLLLTEN